MITIPVPAPVWYDGNGNFLNGRIINVDSTALVVSYVDKPNGPSVPPGSSLPTIRTLFVKDVTHGALYLKMTREEWDVAVALANNVNTLTFATTISEESSSLQDDSLANVTLRQVDYNGTVVDLRLVGYAANGTVYMPFTMQPDDVVQILYT